MLIACLISSAYFIEKFLLSLVFGASPSRSAFPGCFVLGASKILWVAYLILLVFQTTILAFTVLGVIRKRNLRRSSLFRTIYQDGILFYIYLSGYCIINIIVTITAPAYLELSAVSFHRFSLAVLVGRLVINIRRAAFLSPQDMKLVSAPEVSGLGRGIELSSLSNRAEIRVNPGALSREPAYLKKCRN